MIIGSSVNLHDVVDAPVHLLVMIVYAVCMHLASVIIQIYVSLTVYLSLELLCINSLVVV